MPEHGISLILALALPGKEKCRAAWAEIPLTLKAKKIVRENKMEFPYLGFGRTWVQEMSGECGEKPGVKLMITEVQKRKKWRFPYFGFGFAWASADQLILTLLE